MKAEDQINMLNQIPPLSNLEKKRKLRASIVLFVATTVSVLFFVYAFLQKKEADKQFVQAEQRRIELEALKVDLQETRNMAENARREAEAAQIEAERQRALADQALENCKKNKR